MSMTTMDSDPIAPMSASSIPEKKTSPWFQFVARVRTLTGLPQPDAMKLASELRAEKAIDAWTDAEVSPRGVTWLRNNYLVMTPDMLRDKIDAIAALAEKKKEVAAMETEVMTFITSVTSPDSVKNSTLSESITELNAYYNVTVPSQFIEAEKEMFTTATHETTYYTAMNSPDKIRSKMQVIIELIQFIKDNAAKQEAKAAARAEKDAAKEAAKAAVKAEKEAAKAEKEAAKAAEKGPAKETEKTSSTDMSPIKQTTCISPAIVQAPTGGAGTVATSTTVSDISISDEFNRKAIPKHIKTLVWNTYIGEEKPQGKCMSCCATTINIRDFHCGHVLARAKGGDMTIKNLRPICPPCNSSMGTMSMNEFTKTFFGREI